MVPMFLRTTLHHHQIVPHGRGERAIESSVRPRHCHSAIDFELGIDEDPLDNMNCTTVVFPSGPLTNSSNVTLDTNSPTPASLQGCDAANCGLCQTELNVSFTPALSQILLAPTSSTGPIFTTDGDNSTTGEVINSFYFYEDANSTLMIHMVSPKNFRNGTSKIVNGYQAQLYQFPYYLRLLGYRNDWQDLEDYNYECGAVLISLGWSITAAHCFYAQNFNGQMDFLEKFYVIAGIINRGDQHSNVQDRVIMSEYATPHRKYSHETLENDIGILKIPVPFLWTVHVDIISLPSYNFNIMDYVGEVAVASGFGLTSTNGPSSYDLQYAYLDVISRRQCKETFIDIPQSAFCCKDSEYDSSICQGDSGGPITLYDVNNRITVVGVSSFTSEKCGAPPQGFTDVARFRPFIKEVTGL